MTLRDQTVNIFSGIRSIIYLLTAILLFIPMYKIYEFLIALEMSTIASVTIAICFWIICFTVVYMGTEWAYAGRGENEVVPEKWKL